MEFEVGDQVLLSTRNWQFAQGKKLGQRFVGPFAVTLRVGP